MGTEVQMPRPDEPEAEANPQDSSQESEELPHELTVKHPLQYRWVLWYLKQDRLRKRDWEECLKEVACFETVEDFWA
ncbi:unnamed protein product [Soboliphyme baturini]|uniref:Protein Aster-A n=1 Tax=Soboliphyme baturini TaxID=241478 RepID=A0A183IAC7_9BILA|nr:unnamed protein product [Soboliphyme baturini]